MRAVGKRRQQVTQGLSVTILLAIAAMAWALPLYARAGKHLSGDSEDASVVSAEKDNRKAWSSLDLSRIVWPNPPAITRVKYTTYWSGEKLTERLNKEKVKTGWMERLAGVTTGETKANAPRWQLVVPNGVAVDSKDRVYIADSKVRAIFVVNTDTGRYEMIKNSVDARFQWLTGLTIDDSDRLFAADSGLHHVLVFNADRKLEGSISSGLVDPGGLAVDNENRLLYVTDAEQDLVLVYDADPPFALIRKIGRPGTQHTSTSPGEFAKPAAVAVDHRGDVYVSDTWNNRIQVFDADGTFIRSFGKAGDGPGYFARPKGIAVDSDGHVWVADAMQDRIQVFTAEGRLLMWMGEHGMLPGQFQSLVNLTIDRKNRVLTTEQLAGRLQVFQYITNADAKAELARRNAEGRQQPEQNTPRSSSASTASGHEMKN